MASADLEILRNIKTYNKFIGDRSYAHDQFDDESCIEWLGKTDDWKRPVMKVGGAEFTVRAVIYMQRSGRMFPNMDFEVTCKNDYCVNPRHFTYKSTGAPIFRAIVVPPVATAPKSEMHLIPAVTGVVTGVGSLLK